MSAGSDSNIFSSTAEKIAFVFQNQPNPMIIQKIHFASQIEAPKCKCPLH
jgi:hypothetical protein